MRILALCGVLALALGFPDPARAQTVRPAIVRDSAILDLADPGVRYELLKGTFEPSYITLFSGWGNHGDPLLFEGSIVPHLTFAGARLVVVGTPKVLLRMFNQHSAPVRRPSFMPRVSISRLSQPDAEAAQFSAISLALSHHSNGQDGPFYVPGTSALNTRDGSFSLNYLEIARTDIEIDHSRQGMTSARYGARMNLPFNESEALRDSVADHYGTYRVFLSTSGYEPFSDAVDSYVSLDVSYIIDPTFRQDAFLSTSRMDVTLSIVYMPRLAENAGLLVNAFWGQDYYNISYKQRLAVVRIGVVMNAVTAFLRP